MDICAITLDTWTRGQGWETRCPFYPLPPPNRRKPKGRERKGISKAEGKEDMLFTGVDKESVSSSSTQVTPQPLEWKLDSKLVT